MTTKSTELSEQAKVSSVEKLKYEAASNDTEQTEKAKERAMERRKEKVEEIKMETKAENGESRLNEENMEAQAKRHKKDTEDNGELGDAADDVVEHKNKDSEEWNVAEVGEEVDRGVEDEGEMIEDMNNRVVMLGFTQ